MATLSPRSSSTFAHGALLGALSLVYGAQYLDIILLGMFIQPIKAEFALSDTQAGLLTGVAFTALFVILGIPLARIADRGNRKLVVLASAIVFSLGTIFCGLATGFFSLFLMRMIVAVGEAGTVPASVSILSDIFPSSQRRLALSFHSCGAYLGTAIGLLFVGWASPTLGWRHIFGISGIFGLMLAALVALVVREPRRERGSMSAQPFWPDVRMLLANRPFILLALALGVGSISSAASINWVPAFLARSYALPQREIVLLLAAGWGIGALSGGVASGFVTNMLFRKGGKWPLIVVASQMIAFPLLCCIAFLASSAATSIAMFALALFVMGGIRGPSFAAVQDIVPASRRATANSFLMFTMYAIGVTLGPLLTGALSDLLAPSFGVQALRYALLGVIASAGVLATLLVLFAAATIEHAIVDEQAS